AFRQSGDISELSNLSVADLDADFEIAGVESLDDAPVPWIILEPANPLARPEPHLPRAGREPPVRRDGSFNHLRRVARTVWISTKWPRIKARPLAEAAGGAGDGNTEVINVDTGNEAFFRSDVMHFHAVPFTRHEMGR